MPNDNRIRVAIVGAGKFGNKRATAIAAWLSKAVIQVIADQVPGLTGVAKTVTFKLLPLVGRDRHKRGR